MYSQEIFSLSYARIIARRAQRENVCACAHQKLCKNNHREKNKKQKIVVAFVIVMAPLLLHPQSVGGSGSQIGTPVP